MDASQIERNLPSEPRRALPRPGRLLQSLLRQVECCGLHERCRLDRIALIHRGMIDICSRCTGLIRPYRMASFLFDATLTAS